MVAACNSSFELQSQIARVRVLGVRAEPAELVIPAAGPPGIVHLEALAVAPEGRAVSVRFAFCRPFANVFAADFECPGKDGVDLLDGGLSLLDPRILALLGAGVEGGAGAVLASPGFAAQLAVGVPFQVGYQATDGTDPNDGGLELGFATLIARRTDAPNLNPEVLDVQVDGASLDGLTLDGGASVTLTPVVSPRSQEPVVAADGGLTQESLSFSWFTSGEARVGSLRSVLLASGDPAASRTASTTVLSTPDAGARSTLWVVVRDGRGGTSWRASTFTTR
jgi:hypothetical protein